MFELMDKGQNDQSSFLRDTGLSNYLDRSNVPVKGLQPNSVHHRIVVSVMNVGYEIVKHFVMGLM